MFQSTHTILLQSSAPLGVSALPLRSAVVTHTDNHFSTPFAGASAS